MSEPQPPAIPLAILCFFAGQPNFSAVIGDLREEFHQRAQSSGSTAARRWFWRETFRTGWALTAGELLRAPIRTTLLALICFIAIGASTALSPYLFQRNLVDLVYGPQRFWVLVLLSIIPSLVVGWIGGRLLSGREWALALTFILISLSTALIGTLYFLFVVRVDFTELLPLMMSVSFLRLGSFCLGCLCVRGWSAASARASLTHQR
jgi:hypothetical protein